ncbi:hypothetical protein JRQ81_018681 [Phrynocephalus forsythii]|uniref:Uncharacterized protein n=1 Tax=Phrynocephalus forsythii TaxID=171643 RepID=A0A9Q0XQZ2_9SAUR|nr:hypothetical protein JRQ81_018681 [Phrynocephalus forsythii]
MSASSNKEGRKLDIIGHHHYSLASFTLPASNYLCAMGAYQCHLWNKVLLFLSNLPEDQKSKALAYHHEAMALAKQERIMAHHVADASSKKVCIAIHSHAKIFMASINQPLSQMTLETE